MSDDSKNLSRVEDILSGEDYIPTKPMSRIEKLLLEGGGPGGKLPEVTSDDNGKILKVKDGAWDKGEDISGDKLPQVSSSDNGKVLKVVQGEWNIDKDEGDRLPTVTSADEGKVLKVKNGAWDKDVPEKELPETTSEDSGKALMINDNGDWAKSDIPDPAITAEASGNIASFSDGSNLPMPKLQVGIEPVQDLHGYDSPWVGGAGKNKFDGTATLDNKWINAQGEVESQYGFWTSDYIPVKQGDVIRRTSTGSGRGALYDTNKENAVYSSGTEVTATQSGYYRFCGDKSTILPTGQVVCTINNTDLTFAPYSNICPISGWSAVNVNRAKVYQICEPSDSTEITANGVTITYLGKGKYRVKGTLTTNEYTSLNLPIVPFTIYGGDDCYIKLNNSVGLSAVSIIFKNNSSQVDSWGLYPSNRSGSYVGMRNKYTNNIAIEISSSEYGTNFDFTFKVEILSNSTANLSTYNISFGSVGTVYGGTLDVVSGVLVVDRIYKQVKDFEWRTQGGYYGRFFTVPSGADKALSDSNKTLIISDTYKGYSDVDKPTNTNGVYVGSGGSIKIWDSEYPEETDIDAWKTARANVELCYYLDTPTTIQLTPTQVKSLLGSNNVWADTGEIESLIYYKQNAEDIADLIETLVPEELPAITSADNDKILTAYGGEWVPKTNPLPDARNYEAGSVLTVRNNHWNPELLPATPGVPRVESDDVGKVLKATGVDTYDWANGTDIIQTTQDSYDAMSDSQKMNGKLYFVHNESDDEDAAIYFMNKCYGKAPSGSKAVYLPLADYEELTTAEKEDPTKIYFVINEGTKVSPTLSADDGNFTVSSAQSGYDPWKVFDGSTRTDNNEYEYCYAPWGEHNGEWIAYSFGTKQIFSKVHIRAAVMRASTLKYYIEGSNDGETWTNLIPDADYVSVYHPALTSDNHYTWVNTDILLDTAKGKFNKIRFRQDLSIGYPYSGNRFNIANWDIYAAVASNKPSIYYKNVLYTPDELPATTISDAGKVLKVNEDGLWDKGDAPIPDINAVQVPPVIFDNGSLKKINDVNGFPGLEKVFLTPNGYEALTQAEKEDLGKIYYVSLYEFFSSNDGTVVIRLNGDKTERLCFFNGFIDNFNSVTPYANFPEELRDVWTTYSNAPENVASTEYDENGDIRSGRYFGLRSALDWHVNDMDGDWNNYGPKNRANYAVIDMTSSTALQSNPWADPYDIPNGMTIYYGGKQYSEYEPAKPYVELTQAEYDALPSSKESDGMIHFITDAGKIILNGIQYG